MKTLLLSALINLPLAGAAIAGTCEAVLEDNAITAEIVEFGLVDETTENQFLASA